VDEIVEQAEIADWAEQTGDVGEGVADAPTLIQAILPNVEKTVKAVKAVMYRD
jgi:hypothetical protein